MYNGIGKIHTSLENMIMLQNYCKLKNVKLINQFFMDHVFEDIEKNKEHQLINYLYKQLDFENTIIEGMFEYLHTFLSVSRERARNVSHKERLDLQETHGGKSYFNSDGFHPGELGYKVWCENILFPFIEKGNYLK